MPGRIVLNEKLFKIFEGWLKLCVRDIITNDGKLYKKYDNYCANDSSTCKECWRKFLTNDLTRIEDYNPDKVKIIVAGKEIPECARSEETPEYEKCQNAVDNNSNEITATIDDKEIIGPCVISIITKR